MKERLVKIWNRFTTYEKIWFFSVVVLTILVAIFFPSTVDNVAFNPVLIMTLYILDVISNALCELLISKQSKWNFIVSLLVEVIEIAAIIATGIRYATLLTTILFWIPIDIISFIHWNKHKDKEEEDLTVVRSLKGYQQILIILGIIIWTLGVGYLITLIDSESIIEGNTKLEIIVCYLDAMVSAVAICNGIFILLRLKEQWIAWYINTALEIIINIMLGQWVLLVLKAAYLSNTTYGYIKWTKYINKHHKTNEVLNN